MFNTVVAGNCYDGYGFGIDVNYQVFYPNVNSISAVKTTQSRQLLINTNDIDHLGYTGSLEYYSPIYIDIWQGTVNKITVLRSGYKRVRYENRVLINTDIIVDETKTVSTNVNYVNSSGIYNIKPNVNTNGIINMVTYYVYYDINTINNDNATTTNYKLVKIIDKADTSDLVINFLSSGNYKIECEAVIGNLEVSKLTTTTLIVDTVVSGLSTAQEHYLEWE